MTGATAAGIALPVNENVSGNIMMDAIYKRQNEIMARIERIEDAILMLNDGLAILANNLPD